MTEWKKICCAIDFSEPARLAMLSAAELTRRFGAELMLVHVHAPPPSTGAEMAVSGIALVDMVVAEVERTMQAWQDEAVRVSGGPVLTTVIVGDPASEIVRFAQENAFDLVVLATHGRSGFKRFFLGSVAEKVIREASCPVLVVRRRTATEPRTASAT